MQVFHWTIWCWPRGFWTGSRNLSNIISTINCNLINWFKKTSKDVQILRSACSVLPKISPFTKVSQIFFKSRVKRQWRHKLRSASVPCSTWCHLYPTADAFHFVSLYSLVLSDLFLFQFIPLKFYHGAKGSRWWHDDHFQYF